MRDKSLRRGAYPPNNALGRSGVTPFSDQSERDVSSQNGTRISFSTFSHSELVTASRIPRTRSGCSSAATTLSSSSGAGGLNSKFAEYLMTIGKRGQYSSALLTGVLCVHRSHKLRRRDDANTIFRHFLHTCTSVFQFHGLSESPSELSR